MPPKRKADFSSSNPRPTRRTRSSGTLAELNTTTPVCTPKSTNRRESTPDPGPNSDEEVMTSPSKLQVTKNSAAAERGHSLSTPVKHTRSQKAGKRSVSRPRKHTPQDEDEDDMSDGRIFASPSKRANLKTGMRLKGRPRKNLQTDEPHLEDLTIHDRNIIVGLTNSTHLKVDAEISNVESQSSNQPKNKSITQPQTTEVNAQNESQEKEKPACGPLNRMPPLLPSHLLPCLNAQKRAILQALQHLPTASAECEGNFEEEEEEESLASQQLSDLLKGVADRGEGNSCLLLGPRGSGKTKLIEKCLSTLSEKLIILRLSGLVQHSDRLAMREIAYQLNEQTGHSFLPEHNETENKNSEDENPFVDLPNSYQTDISSNVSLPPSAHLPALISILPTLNRPSVVILDAFERFAHHPRQSLLYSLLDTVQSCRASLATKGIAVIGVTSQVDAIQLLEKRVKSRFSGRIIRTAAPRRVLNWMKVTRAVLLSNSCCGDAAHDSEWRPLWSTVVTDFLANAHVLSIFKETFSITKDVRVLSRILTNPIARLSPSSPILDAAHLSSSATTQLARPRFPFLSRASYPSMCLLIACVHSDAAGHPMFTFEMLHERFRDQVRSSSSAPVQINGGSIGMMRCTREVLMNAFEALITARIFICVASSSPNIGREYARYHSIAEKEDVKRAVEKAGQISLKKWLNKAQM